jgi:glycosyltransferase involved in cell wall biosynthesis
VRGRIVGDGPLRAALASRAATAGVEILGDRQDVAKLLGEADVAVFTSEAQSEGMPGVLIEAGLSGLPVVATGVPGASTVIADGSTGFVVPQHDFEALVERVRQLVEDPGRRQEMGAAARQRCEQDYSTDASVAAWRRLLAAVAPPVAVGPNSTASAGSSR